MSATNREYSAFLADNELLFTRLGPLLSQPKRLPCPGGSEGTYSALALSRTQPAFLAIACSSQVYIVDLEDQSCKHYWVGIGRVVTAVAFADDDAGTVAIGHIDGSICIWQPGDAKSSFTRLLPTLSSCHVLAFSPGRTNILAAASDDRCEVWHVHGRSSRLICSLDTSRSRCVSLAWCLSNPEKLVLYCEDEDLRFFDLASSLHSTTARTFSGSSRSPENGLNFLGSRILDDFCQPTGQLGLGFRCDNVFWIHDSILIAHAQGGNYCILLSLSEDLLSTNITWRCSFKELVRSIDIQLRERILTILGISEVGVERHDVPDDIWNGCRLWRVLLNTMSSISTSDENDIEPISPERDTPTERGPAMRPISISLMRNTESSFARTSRQLQRLRQRRSSRSLSNREHRDPGSQADARDVDQPPGASTTSSLELLQPCAREEVISPMPFLSPAIPAQETSFFHESSTPMPIQLPRSSVIAALPDSEPLPSPERDSDDSDDESFADDMQRSMTFLPGGVNVPLPKACGALFHPNGQLLTFFPPKQQQLRPVAEEAVAELRLRRDKSERLIRLFPSFGNLERRSLTDDDGSSIDSEDALDEDAAIASHTQESSTRPTSTIIQPVSNLEQLGIPSAHGEVLSQSRLIVRVYEIDDFQLLSPSLSALAQEYRILCDDGESGAQLCEHNARVAREFGHEQVAQAWWIVSKLLEDRVPLLAINTNKPLNGGIWRVAQQSQLLAPNELDAGFLAGNGIAYEGFGKLRWAGHPLGETWLLRRLLDWAERQADVQFLACAVAVLTQVDAQVPSNNAPAEQSTLSHLATHSLDYFTYASEASRLIGKPNTPLLRAHAASVTASNDSPTKRLPGSSILSRSSSQMATPAPESTNGTPPWSFSLTRQSTSLSTTSGSASPDVHRGSFGIPATRTQSYAQSISEKAAMLYNWSPTPGRSDGLPNANGALSSSLPNGSWAGKSVSFASTTYTDDTRGNSWSSVPHLLNVDDDADSDKTVEDSSTPHTPKGPGGVVGYELSNTGMFADEASGGAKGRLLPADLEDAGRLWCQYYAELLRSWGMYVKAAELEKAIGLAVEVGTTSNPTELGMQPAFRQGRRKTSCVICDTIALGVVQICPACLHVSHFRCLQDFLAELGENTYSCPSGCGCSCSELAYEVREIVAPQTSPPQVGPRRKPSFTDPRRWRARVEGDSW